MTSVSQRRFGFISASVYRRREPHAFTYLSERATFWIAIISVFAFVTGNMIGQHGWAVFWKSVMGEGIESTIVFTGMAPPVAQVPDLERWGRLGGDIRTHTFRQVPRDLLVPLPKYVAHGDDLTADPVLRQIYFVEHLGTYENGREKGSHVGVDISVPKGTPVVSVANGVVKNVGDDAGGFGNYVVVKHPNIPRKDGAAGTIALYSAYAHLSSVLVTEGAVVQKGEEIGLSGSTGNTTAPHLHVQMDTENAPFHPYWLFSGSEQRRAGMSFSQAINKGLNRERGIENTLDPMLTVQAYATYQAPIAVVETSAASPLASSVRSRMTVAERRQVRLAKRGPLTTLIAFSENGPVIPISSSSSASSASVSAASSSMNSSVAPVTAQIDMVRQGSPQVGTIRGIRISHDGSYGKERGWERLTLQLLDGQGRVVVSSFSNEALYLRTAFGKAEFKPDSIPLSQFRKGVAHVEMLPLGDQTVVVRVEPTGDLSSPMKYVR